MEFNFKIPAILALALSAACTSAPTPPPAAPDGGDAQRLVALLDYVGGDYRMAVKDGVVLKDSEYEEQLHFVADATRMAERLAPPSSGADALLRLVHDLDTKVHAKADAELVAQASKAAREEAVAHFHLATMPSERPSLARAQTLFTEACAKCHGANGDGDTEQAKLLDPRPARFRDPQRLVDMSPYRVYNALTFGVSGTAMASFSEALPPADRWSLAFFVFRLGHEGQPQRGPVAMTLADLASRSDRDVLATLKAEGFPSPEEGLIFARRETAFAEAPTGVGIDRMRRMLRSAEEASAAGRREDADRIVLDAYLQGFEPLETRLRVRDAEGTEGTEKAFHSVRTALLKGDQASVHQRTAELDARLASLSGSRSGLPLMGAALIFFREGIEAALLVGALLAGLRRMSQPGARRFVHAGWIAALPAGVATWWLFERILAVPASQRELMEAVVSLLAAVVLFSMSFWMISKVEARRWSDYLKRHLEKSLNQRKLGVLFGVAFLAVYREAAETVLFTQALLLEADAQRAQVWAGAAIGLVAVVLAAAVMNRAVRKLPLGPFFAVSSVLLCGLAISFAGAGVFQLVEGGYVPPRPVSFPEVEWMGIHPDLTGLLVQLVIVSVVLGAGIMTYRRREVPVPVVATRREP